jgi:NAD(P)-dependent dehydrogenase (short-subunit alcohol dehydrogenase family)
MPVYPVQADLTSSTNIESLFSTLDTLPHPLKVLVNSAALMPRGDVRTLSAADFDAAIALNLRAPFLCAQEAAKRMEDGGLIVNVTDIGAQKAWSGFPAYTVSKAGLESLTRVLARSLAPRIRVNAIAPGLVLQSEYVSEEEWNRLVERLPLRRPASVDEITSALEFLLENEYITGQTIVVDGGYSLL